MTNARPRAVLRGHMNKMHPKDKSLYCPICDIHFENKAKMRRHMNVHEEPKFPCPFCERRLKSKIALEDHMRQHTGENPFSCDICEQAGIIYTCKSSVVLIRHKKDRHNFTKTLYEKQLSLQLSKIQSEQLK